MTWRKVECPFEKDRKILQYLLTAPVFTEDGEFNNEWVHFVGPLVNMKLQQAASWLGLL